MLIILVRTLYQLAKWLYNIYMKNLTPSMFLIDIIKLFGDIENNLSTDPQQIARVTNIESKNQNAGFFEITISTLEKLLPNDILNLSITLNEVLLDDSIENDLSADVEGGIFKQNNQLKEIIKLEKLDIVNKSKIRSVMSSNRLTENTKYKWTIRKGPFECKYNVLWEYKNLKLGPIDNDKDSHPFIKIVLHSVCVYTILVLILLCKIKFDESVKKDFLNSRRVDNEDNENITENVSNTENISHTNSNTESTTHTSASHQTTNDESTSPRSASNQTSNDESNGTR
jgi:hypothetical protein